MFEVETEQGLAKEFIASFFLSSHANLSHHGCGAKVRTEQNV